MHVKVHDYVCVALATANGMGFWVPDAVGDAGALILTSDEAIRLRSHVVDAIDLDGDGHASRLRRLDAAISECFRGPA